MAISETYNEFLKKLFDEKTYNWVKNENKENEFIEKIKNIVDKTYPIVTSDVINDILSTNEDIYKEDITQQLTEILEIIDSFSQKVIEQPWINKKAIIAFAGKFSAGKSSIINSLFEKKILPTAITPATAIPTYITPINGLEEEFIAVTKLSQIKKLPLKYLTQITKEEIQKSPIPLSIFIQYFVLSFNLSFNKDNIIDNILIIDTPGYDPGEGDGNIDEERTKDTIKISDVVFWVMDINDGDLSRDSITFLKQNISDQKLYILINKCDLKPPSRIESIKKKVETTLNSEELPYEEVLFFSSRSKDKKYINKIKNIILHELSVSKYDNKYLELISWLQDTITVYSDLIKYKKESIIEKLNIIENLKSLKHNLISTLIKFKDPEAEEKFLIDDIRLIEDLKNNMLESYKDNFIGLKSMIESIKNDDETEEDIEGDINHINLYRKFLDNLIKLSSYFEYDDPLFGSSSYKIDASYWDSFNKNFYSIIENTFDLINYIESIDFDIINLEISYKEKLETLETLQGSAKEILNDLEEVKKNLEIL